MIVNITYNEPSGIEWCNPPFDVALAVHAYLKMRTLPTPYRHNFLRSFIRGDRKFYKGLRMYLTLDTGEYVPYVWTGTFPESLFENRELRNFIETSIY